MTNNYLLLTAQFVVSNTAYPENVLTRKKKQSANSVRHDCPKLVLPDHLQYSCCDV